MPVGTITFEVIEDKHKLSIEFIFMTAPQSLSELKTGAEVMYPRRRDTRLCSPSQMQFADPFMSVLLR